MPDIFQINKRDMRHLIKFFKNAPRDFQRASAGTLTTFAFEARKSIIGAIEDNMTVRNPKFVSSRVQVNKAKPGPLSSQVSEVGSVATARFSGWVEQQRGTQSTQSRIFTLAARNEDWNKKMSKASKLQSGSNILTEGDVEGQTKQSRRMNLIRRAKRDKRPFILGKTGNKKGGLYRFKRNKLNRLQTFGEKPKPKRIKWLDIGINRFEKIVNVRKIWGNQLDFVLKRYKK